ncbi:MAG: 50S ribosomal protein L6 [Patescibacteria group bacterium]
MSKLARKPIAIPQGVTITKGDGKLLIKGAKGELTIPVLQSIAAEIKDNAIMISTNGFTKQARSNVGTVTALVKNAFIGVTEGYTQKLEVEGVGYKASMEGDKLLLNVGFSHSIKVDSVPGASVTVEKNTITVTGIDKAIVGQVAATIRKVKKPEPYKGKGIRYTGEAVRRKAGKKVAGAGAA